MHRKKTKNRVKKWALVFWLGLLVSIFSEEIPLAYCDDKSLIERNIAILNAMPDPVGDDRARLPEGERVELFNFSDETVSLAGWVLYDSDNKNELFLTAENIFPQMDFPLLRPGEKLTVFRDGDSDFSLDDEKDSIRLFSGPMEMEGKLQSELNYNGGEEGKAVSAERPGEIKLSLEQENEVITANNIFQEEIAGKNKVNKNIILEKKEQKQQEENPSEKNQATLKNSSPIEPEGENRISDRAEDEVSSGANRTKKFIAGIKMPDKKDFITRAKEFFGGFSLKLFLIAWLSLAGAIFLTRRILKI